MRSISEIYESIGYDAMAKSPKKEVKVYGYAKGKIVGEFDTEKEAKIAGSTITETFTKNLFEIESFKSTQNSLQTQADKIFKDELKEDYSHSLEYLTKKSGERVIPQNIQVVFDKIYDRVKDKCRGEGYDSIADSFGDEINYLMDLL